VTEDCEADATLGPTAAVGVGEEGPDVLALGCGVFSLDVSSVAGCSTSDVCALGSWASLASMSAISARISYGHMELFTWSGAWASKVKQISMTCGGGSRPKYCFLIA